MNNNTHDWMPGVEHSPMPDPAAYTSPYPNRVVWHITTGHSGFDNMKSYLRTSTAPTPHFLVDPWSGRIAQFYQVYSRAKGLKVTNFNPNRTGDLCIQVEILHDFSNGDVKDTPRRGITDKLVPYFRQFDIPDRWCLGMPHRTHDQNMDVWLHQGGHYGHSQVPGNDHSDPGDMGNIFSFSKDNGDDDMNDNQNRMLQEIHDDIRKVDFGMRREIIETKDRVSEIHDDVRTVDKPGEFMRGEIREIKDRQIRLEENQKEILRLLRSK